MAVTVDDTGDEAGAAGAAGGTLAELVAGLGGKADLGHDCTPRKTGGGCRQHSYGRHTRPEQHEAAGTTPLNTGGFARRRDDSANGRYSDPGSASITEQAPDGRAASLAEQSHESNRTTRQP
ncbi:hypothetical protein GCM10010442_21820 [Kitasatospora kifunensis]